MNYKGWAVNGFLALFVQLVVIPLLVFLAWKVAGTFSLFLIPLLVLIFALMVPGYFSQEPNEARVMVFFGKYKGTFRETGFYWVNPFLTKKKLSLRARNLDVEPI